MAVVELLQRIHRRPLLRPQPFAHLRPVRAPVIRVDVAFVAGGIKSAHRGRTWPRWCRWWRRSRERPVVLGRWDGSLALRQRPAHAANSSRITQILSLIFLGISYLAWCDRPLRQRAGLGRFMRLGWRYHQMIRTFRNHAAVSFSQCTGALSASQGSVLAWKTVSPETSRNALPYSNYMDEPWLSTVVPPECNRCYLTQTCQPCSHFVRNSKPPGKDNPL